jgi:hypothetical protein
MRARSLLATFAMLAFGCGASGASSTAITEPPTGMKDAVSGTKVERFFPLVDGKVYQYTTQNEMGEEGLLIARVFRADGTHGELRYPSGRVKRFEYAEDGVKITPSGSYVLKAPLDATSTWRGENGGKTRILALNASVDVKAGHFAGCVQTLEERGGDQPVRYATTFCPDVGIVLLEAASGANLERAELKSYGAPTEVGPDGLRRLPQ